MIAASGAILALLLTPHHPAFSAPIHTSRLAARLMTTFPPDQRRVLVLVIDTPGRSQNVIASSARAAHNTCILRFRTEEIAANDLVIAHEVCHCANDWDAMVGTQWAPAVTPESQEMREMLADSCAYRILERDRDRPHIWIY